jgi:hypothetical protein
VPTTEDPITPCTTRREFFGQTLTAAAAAALAPALTLAQPTHGAPQAAPPLALELARFLHAVRFEDLPRVAVEHAKIVVASTLASAAAGSRIESARIIRELAKEQGGRPEATVWFDGAHVPIVKPRVNAVQSDARPRTTAICATWRAPTVAAAVSRSASARALKRDVGHVAVRGRWPHRQT